MSSKVIIEYGYAYTASKHHDNVLAVECNEAGTDNVVISKYKVNTKYDNIHLDITNLDKLAATTDKLKAGYTISLTYEEAQSIKKILNDIL